MEFRGIFCQHLSSRERASLHRGVLVGGRCLEFIESCVSRIGDRSTSGGLEVFAGCFCGAGNSEIGKV